MYKSFKFVLFNESFPNPAQFWTVPDISQICTKKGRISAGAGAELRYSPTMYVYSIDTGTYTLK